MWEEGGKEERSRRQQKTLASLYSSTGRAGSKNNEFVNKRIANYLMKGVTTSLSETKRLRNTEYNV
jgi:hypothetical protein